MKRKGRRQEKETLPVNSCSGLPLAYNLPQTLVLSLRLQFSPSSLNAFL